MAKRQNADLILELGHICPLLKNKFIDWTVFEMVSANGDLFSYECPVCHQRISAQMAMYFRRTYRKTKKKTSPRGKQ